MCHGANEDRGPWDSGLVRKRERPGVPTGEGVHDVPAPASGRREGFAQSVPAAHVRGARARACAGAWRPREHADGAQLGRGTWTGGGRSLPSSCGSRRRPEPVCFCRDNHELLSRLIPHPPRSVRMRPEAPTPPSRRQMSPRSGGGGLSGHVPHAHLVIAPQGQGLAARLADL